MFMQAKLDNGLTIIAEINPAAASMAAGFFVRTGSRDETSEISGVSHFLEHMLFKGTARRSALDVNREFDEMGANYNAGTSHENTVYYGAVLPEFQDRLLDLLGDLMRPSLRQEDFDVEKNVIIGEIALYEDMPSHRVYDRLMTEYFAPHPLGNSILGSKESITVLKREQMQEYFDRCYSPGNITVVGVGNIDFDRFRDKVAAICSGWKYYDVPRHTPVFTGTPRDLLICDKKVNREHIGFMSPAPSWQDDRRFVADLLSSIIGDSTGSRLYYALVDPAIADEASMFFTAMDGTGTFMTFVSCDESRSPQAVEIVRRELRKFQEEGPTDGEIEAAKNKIASGATLKGEVPMGRLEAVGFDWVYRHEYIPLSEQIEMLYAVTRQQIIDLARQYDLTNLTTLALGPRERI